MSNGPKKQWTNRRGAQPVSDLVSKLLDPVIERRAGMTMDLIASWEDIVGARHANRSRPEKLQWPRPPGGDVSGDVRGDFGNDLSGERSGSEAGGAQAFEAATLVVACDGGHALYLQHDGDTILAQVNDYFGFSAVGRLKLVQKPIAASHRNKVGSRFGSDRQIPVGDATFNLAAAEQDRLNDLVSDVEDEQLKNALINLGRGVFSERSSPKK